MINNSNNPYFNHAVEEYLLDNLNKEVFMLWINRPSILIGRNQNTITEIDQEFVKTNNIDVVRRLSGGGTVYNDYGNINFTFITYKNNASPKGSKSFKRFAKPIIEALNSLNVNANFTGRNDITIDNKKISGNAQYFHKNKLLHHGTLLYNCNLKKLSKALNSKPLKFKGKGIKSVSSRVTNISDHISEKMDLIDFKDYLMTFIMNSNNIEEIYKLKKKDIEEIEKIMESRFKLWNWNYGKNSAYSYEHSIKYPSGLIEYHLDVSKGVIKNISIYGDFFGKKDIKEIETILIGQNHNINCLKKALKNIDMKEYIIGLSTEEFLKGLISIDIQ